MNSQQLKHSHCRLDERGEQKYIKFEEKKSTQKCLSDLEDTFTLANSDTETNIAHELFTSLMNSAPFLRSAIAKCRTMLVASWVFVFFTIVLASEIRSSELPCAIFPSPEIRESLYCLIASSCDFAISRCKPTKKYEHHLHQSIRPNIRIQHWVCLV